MAEKQQIDSLWLNEVLDIIGLSNKMRNMHIERGMLVEALQTLLRGKQEMYNFGSTCEGTTTPGLEKDVDYLICDPGTVSEFLIPSKLDNYFLMVRDEHTRPGYVKIQAVCQGMPLTSAVWKPDWEKRFKIKLDHKGRIVRSNIPPDRGDYLTKLEMNGPAETLKMSVFLDVDGVQSLRCANWPTFAMEWLNRNRKHNWPSKDTIADLKNWGYFLVRKGHPHSEEQVLEWRVSFSQQERALIHSFNETQYKCLVLLKLIKNDLIKVEMGESISSYHCKTCMFNAIEETPQKMWVKENLINCLVHCLKMLLFYVESWNCPNYFIPDENMFDRLDKESIQTRLQNLITGFIHKQMTFLFRIKTDNIGDFLESAQNHSKVLELKQISRNTVASDARSIHVSLVREVLFVVNKIYHALNNCDQLSGVGKLMKHYSFLNQFQCTPELTKNKINDANGLVMPFISTSFGCHLVSYAIQDDNQSIRDWLVVVAAQYFRKGMQSDVASSRLKFATVLYTLGLNDACSLELDAVEEAYKTKTSLIHMCQCREFGFVHSMNLRGILDTTDVTISQLFQSHISTCVMFLPFEINIIPEALKYEMFRSMGTFLNTSSWIIDYWYKWVAMDSITYLYFMRYLVAINQDKGTDTRCAAINGITESLHYPLVHRETAGNIFGWIFFREKFYIEAMKSLIGSWRKLEEYVVPYHTGIRKLYQSHHNAAKWHMLVFLYKLWTGRLRTDNDEEHTFCFGCLESYSYAEDVKTCTKCHVAKYCSRRCQSKDWSNHKTACNLKSNSHV